MRFSETQDPALHRARVDYIDRRWRGLYDEQLDVGKTIIRYLLGVNAGGMVATLSFMGAMKSLDPMPYARLVLLTFSVGLVLVGFGLAFASYRLDWLLTNWRDDTVAYYANTLDWESVLERDRGRQESLAWVAHVLAWLSFFSFIAGIATAAKSLLF